MFCAEVHVRHDAAQITAARATILCGRVQQIAVGHPVVIGVGPRTCHARGAERRRRLRHSKRGVAVRIVARHAGALEVLADAGLEYGPTCPEQVVGNANPWGEVLVAVYPACLRDDDRRRKKSRWAFLLGGKPAARAIESQRTLQRDTSVGPLFLHEQAVPRVACIVHPWRDRLGELIGLAVVDAIRQVLVVGVPRPIVRHQRVLVADLHAVCAGYVRQRAFPQIRAGMRDAEVLRAIHQTRECCRSPRSRSRTARRRESDRASDSVRARSCPPRSTCRRNPSRGTAGSRSETTMSPGSHPACGRERRPLPARLAAGSISPGVAPVHCRQSDWTSQNALIVLRGVARHVTRPLAFSYVRSEYSGRPRSGA